MLNYWRVNYVIRKRRATPMLSSASEDEQNLSQPHLRLWTLPLEATRKHTYFNQQESLTKRRGDFSQSWKGCETNRTEEMAHKMENMGMAQTDYISKKNDWFPQDRKNNRGFPMMSHFGANFFLGVYVLEKQLYRVGCTNVDTGARHNIGLLLISRKSRLILSPYYPLVNKHSNGKSPFLIGKPSINGPFSIAMLVHQSVSPLW